MRQARSADTGYWYAFAVGVPSRPRNLVQVLRRLGYETEDLKGRPHSSHARASKHQPRLMQEIIEERP